MVTEESLVIVASSDRLLTRQNELSSDAEAWMASASVPGERIIGTWEVSHRQFVILTTSGGKYQIFHTVDRRTHTLVHTHDTEIFGIFNLGFGKSIFCATDGWWMTLDSGMSWLQIALTGPAARSLVVVKKPSALVLFAYDINDRQVYRCEHPMNEFLDPMVWEVVYSADLLVSPWYPVIAGGSSAVIIGVGDKVIRTEDLGETWKTVATASGVVKSITVSDTSSGPTFLVEVEANGLSQLYWSYDLCDSLTPDVNRSGLILDAKAVIPTGESESMQMFVVIGQHPDGRAEYRFIDRVG